MNHPRTRFAVLAGALIALSPGSAVGQDSQPPSTHASGGGIAFNSRDSATVVRGKSVSILLVCEAGATPCRGSIVLKTRKPVRTRAKGPRRLVTVAGGPYGEIAAGAYKKVTYRLRRAARFHVLRHRATATRIVVRVEGNPDPVHLPLRDRVTVRNPKVVDR